MLRYLRMACPYFHPDERLAGWPKPPLLPLGDPWAGACHADPAGAFRPAPETLRELCNLGYARGRCGRFPPGDGPDAVRFCVSYDRDGLIGICCVRERNHHPFDRGSLEYSAGRQAFSTPHTDPAVQLQAEAYVASYLRRTRKAS